MSKGEVRINESGCERDVFTTCLYHGKFAGFHDGDHDAQDKSPVVWKGGVIKERWEAAQERASSMLKECAGMTISAKVAKLRKRTKNSKAAIKFQR